jgi:hypothetical protein
MTDKKAEGEAQVSAAIAGMTGEDRTMGEQLHRIITANAPGLIPRTWYGMPAYSKDGKIVCFFRSRAKFGERYLTVGFNDTAKLDEGNMWPVYFALKEVTDKEETRIIELVRKAIS